MLISDHKNRDNLQIIDTPTSKVKVKIWLVCSQLAALISLPFWFVIAGLSLMAFDSGVNLFGIIVVGTIWLYPLWPIFFCIYSWRAYRRGKHRLASFLSAMTFTPALLFYILIDLF